MSRRLAAVFCRTFLPYSETFIHDELTHHVRWDVDVFCRHRINADRFPYPRVLTPGGRLARLAYRATTYAPAFERTLRERRHRLLHAHFGPSAVYAHTYHRLLRIPLIVTFHGYDVGALIGTGGRAPKLWRYAALAPTLLARADMLLCPSLEVQQLISELSGRPDATRLYRLGIDLTRFQPRGPMHGTAQVIMIGRFVEKKGHLDGLAAFARVVRRGHAVRMIVIGAGPLASAYRARIDALGLKEHVELVGPRTPAEVARLLAASDVLLAPSRVARSGDRDSGLLVVKEASASALPVIGTRVGGIPEIIDDERTGYLVDEGDVDELAERLDRLLARPDLRATLGAAGRAKMEREYNLRDGVAHLEQLYDEVAT